MLQLYKNIKRLREELGMSQEELALKSQYGGRSTIARIEKGQIDVPVSKIHLLAKALGVSTPDLVGWDGDEEISNMAVALADTVTDPLAVELIEKFGKLENSRKHKALGYIDRLLDEQSE